MYESHCPICLDIYIEPVALPCKHCFCKPCFEQILKKAALQCALCRVRIGSWARLHSRNGTLVDVEHWNYLKKHFSTDIKARLDGKPTPKKSGKLKDSGIRGGSFPIPLAKSGEIRKEYEAELEKLKKEREEQERASEELIKKILAQEKVTISNDRLNSTAEEELDDTEVISTLHTSTANRSMTISQGASTSSSSALSSIREAGKQTHARQKANTNVLTSAGFRRTRDIPAVQSRQPTQRSRHTKANAPAPSSPRLPLPRRSSSIDSITGEINKYFKPIVRYPRTPPGPDDRTKGYPETIKVTPAPQTMKRLDFSKSCSPPDAPLQTRSKEKPLSDLTDNIQTLSATTVGQSPGNANTRTTAPASSTFDHQFVLPLSSSITCEDENSSDCVSLSRLVPSGAGTAGEVSPSASNSTSLSQPRLRIMTSSPGVLIPDSRGTPDTVVSQPNGDNDSNAVTPDTMSYRSEASPSESTCSYQPPVKRRRQVTSSASSCNTTRSSAKQRQVRSSKVNKGATGSSTNVCNLQNGAYSITNGYSTAAKNGSIKSRSKSSKTSSPSGVTSRSQSTKSILSSCSVTEIDEQIKIHLQKNSDGVDVTLDELYALKLQRMYDLESSLHLTALRFPGSGNEYYTRGRKNAQHPRKK